MMSVLEYANDVNKKVEFVLELCKKLDIKANNLDDMLTDDDIILLDNELEKVDTNEDTEHDVIEDNMDDFEDSYEEELEEVKVVATVKKKKKGPKKDKKDNKDEYAMQKKEMYKHKEKLQSNVNTIDDTIVLYTEGMSVAELANVLNEEFEDVMKEVYEAFVKDKNLKEFTVECGRPDSITSEKLQTMKTYDVTRISINPQTMNDDTLKMIGRGHTSAQVIEKFNLARSMGFNDINMDMIIGLPGEGIKEVLHTKNEILKLKPDSLTVHGLSLKRASILYENFILKKGIQVKKQEELAQMYEESRILAQELGLHPYYMYRQKNMVGNMENLGYSRKGAECIYNIEMIEDKQTIIALGADAVSKVVFLDENRIERFANIKDIKEYCNRIDEMIQGKINLLDSLYLKGEE